MYDWSATSIPKGKDTHCGDQYLVEPLDEGLLIAVVDGLGHSNEAEEVAKAAIEALKLQATSPVERLMGRCHEILQGTRGAVVSLALYQQKSSSMTWLGVGDIAGSLLRASPRVAGRRREYLITQPGIVGYRIPPLRPMTVPIYRNDMLVIASDGVASTFAEVVSPSDSPATAVQRILSTCLKGDDDALALAAKFHHEGSS